MVWSTMERYPGSDREIGDRPDPLEPRDWGRPVQYNVGGVPTDFYYVGHLALALKRSPVTLRKWERAGIIPIATFRSPAQVKAKAKRLYTRAQLEAIEQIAREEGLLQFTRSDDGHEYPVGQVTKTNFTERVREAFKRLAGI